MKNILLVVVGFVMMTLGVIGIAVPILPTTPFVIVATACFSSTPTLHSRMKKIPFVSEYITNYEARKGVSRKTVTVSLVFLWIMLAVSAVTVRSSWIILFLAIIGMAITIHIIMVSKPRKRENEQERRQ